MGVMTAPGEGVGLEPAVKSVSVPNFIDLVFIYGIFAAMPF